MKVDSDNSLACHRVMYCVLLQPIGVTPSMTDSQKEAQEELEVKAIAVLDEHFMRLFHAKTKLKRLRRITTDEMPWRAQVIILVT